MQVIKSQNGVVFISFLDQQLSELDQKKTKLSEFGKLGQIRKKEKARLEGGLSSGVSYKDKDKDKDKDNLLAEAKKEEKPERKKDPIWDTVTDIFGINPQTKSERSRIGKVVADLKIKEATPDRIEKVLSAFREVFPGATPTPEAILKHWDTCKNFLINGKQQKPMGTTV